MFVIAIVGTNLFNQGYWQRVWISQTDRDMRRAFLIASIITVPAIMLAGSYGFIAQGTGTLSEPSAAQFDLVANFASLLVILTVLALAVAFVVSSLDTLLNALVSLFTVDIARLRPGLSGPRLLAISRWLTLVPALLAGLIALQVYSELYLFLVAGDLRRCGALFPDPNFTSGNLFQSFAAAALFRR